MAFALTTPWTFPVFDPSLETGFENMWKPSLDIRETPTEYKIVAEVPGVDKENIKIELQNGVLTLCGEKKQEKKEEKENYFRSERIYGKFSRSIRVPTEVTEKDIKACFKNGVLEVCFPKKTQQQSIAQPCRIPIA
jgi:HSP20 family protein